MTELLPTAPLLISVAPNGARRTGADHPRLPLTPDALAREAVLCAEAGAALLHLHVRDAEGRHSLDPDLYRAALAAVGEAVGERLVVQVTTEACGAYDRAAQMQAVRELRPQAASYALREFVLDGEDDRTAARFFAESAEAGVLAQFILYTPAEAATLRRMAARGATPDARPAVLFVLGRYDDGPASESAALLGFIAAWGDAGPWSVCAFGPAEAQVAAAALALGGHVRVGFENNLQRPDGSLLASNAEQVGRIAGIAALVGRPLADAQGARAILHPVGRASDARRGSV